MTSPEKSSMVLVEGTGAIEEDMTDDKCAEEKFLFQGLEHKFDINKNAISGFPTKCLYYKQVFALGIGWMFLFMAIITLRNLQSSLNHADGLGLIAMGTFYGGMMIGAFASSATVQSLGPRATLGVSAAFHVLFVASNFYPYMPLMATVGAVAGISHSMLWAAQSTFLTALAKSFSEKFSKSYDHVLSRFIGVVFLFIEGSVVIGNPLASLILGLDSSLQAANKNVSENLHMVAPNNYSYEEIKAYIADTSAMSHTNTSETMFCGRHYCHSYISGDSKISVTTQTRCLIVGVFTASAVLALVTFVTGIKDRHVYVRKPGCSDLGDKLLGTLQSLLDPKMLLFFPFMAFFGFQMAFVSGDIIKAYITCSVGIHHVGNLMLFYGILDAISSIVSGWMKQFLGSLVMFTMVVLLNGAVFIALLVWTPDGGVWGYVLFAACGCIQGMTNIHVNSQIGVVFRHSVESAYSLYRLFQGFGMSVGYIYSPYFCMEAKIWTAITLFSVAAVCYYALEVVHRRSLRLPEVQNEKVLEI